MANICPTCSKQVYQAEQTIGPGGKIYHKPCLACQSCNKRLDSLSLLEHDLQPYCKSCHLRLFGTRDLRHANLPQAVPPLSPIHTQSYSSQTSTPARSFASGRTGPYSPTTTNATGINTNSTVSPPPRSRPPPTPSFWATKGIDPSPRLPRGVVAAPSWDDDEDSGNNSTTTTAAVNTNQRIGTQSLAHTSQHTYSRANEDREMHVDEHEDRDHDTDHEEHEEVRHALMSELRARSSSPPAPAPQLAYASSSRPFSSSSNSNAFSSRPAPSGTRYGVALTGGSPNSSPTQSPVRVMHGVVPISPQGTGTSTGTATLQRFTAGGSSTATPQRTGASGVGAKPGWSGSLTPTNTGGSGVGTPKRWGGGGETPLCARCGGKVYFAEQVKAVDKTFHKGCLRCTDCGTSLDSRSLRDHEGIVVCVRCYNKNYGPQGGGYALLGKAGG